MKLGILASHFDMGYFAHDGNVTGLKEVKFIYI